MARTTLFTVYSEHCLLLHFYKNRHEQVTIRQCKTKECAMRAHWTPARHSVQTKCKRPEDFFGQYTRTIHERIQLDPHAWWRSGREGIVRCMHKYRCRDKYFAKADPHARLGCSRRARQASRMCRAGNVSAQSAVSKWRRTLSKLNTQRIGRNSRDPSASTSPVVLLNVHVHEKKGTC